MGWRLSMVDGNEYTMYNGTAPVAGNKDVVHNHAILLLRGIRENTSGLFIAPGTKR